MKYTPDEIAELLKDKPHQPHYIAAMVRKAVEAERERCAKLCDEIEAKAMADDKFSLSDIAFGKAAAAEACAEAIRAS